ncbi:hypothetical protein [Octadecabacter sp. R77987]|uniref:hypothetical protein n=1 Tax=Octadecabacter sp. R77987 TaxID=3093874 RepID=UPI003670DF5F
MIKQGILLAACMGLVACGDPLRDVDRLSDVAVADRTAASVSESPADAAQAARSPGLFGRLLGRAAPDEDAAVTAALESAQAASAPATEDAGIAGEPVADDDPAAVPAGEAAADPAEPPARRGLFGGLFGGRRAAAEPATPTGPDAQSVTTGEAVGFGAIARACDTPTRRLGTEIARTSGFRLYDTIPNSTAPRTHYITGFADNCPRQFTAAVAIFSDVGTHEVVRYQDSNDRIAYSDVDNAYEAIKARVCRVAHGQPCGSRLERLGRDTLFVTVYERFGGNTTWSDILIYDGEVVAMDRKEG